MSIDGEHSGDKQDAPRHIHWHKWHHLFRRLTGLNLPCDHPLHIALRTYILFASLSVGPVLTPLLLRRALGRGSPRHSQSIATVLLGALGASGLAFAMTTAVGGGALLSAFLRAYTFDASSTNSQLYGARVLNNSTRKSFVANAVASLFAITLLQSRSKRKVYDSTPQSGSHTLDFTLVILVRAFDALWRAAFLHARHNAASAKGKQRQDDTISSGERAREKLAELSSELDAFLFWAASARIMWCFFYKPHRLPKSYLKWINTMANVDDRLIQTLRLRREGTWTYGEVAPTKSLSVPMVTELGYPAKWGNPSYLPPVGGPSANVAWKELGVKSRDCVGGMPCEIIHGRIGKYFGPLGGSCSINAISRGGIGFLEALLIYSPVHTIPILLSKPKSLLSIISLRRLAFSITRSSLFLSTFISSIWFAVCTVRTLIVARLLPCISHNFYDGPYGGVLAGSLVCGSSIWLEQGRRRGEIALYVLPRAIRSMFKASWLQRMPKEFMLLERLIFAVSLSTILTVSKHYPDSLRGLSRWTLLFIMEGPAVWRNFASA